MAADINGIIIHQIYGDNTGGSIFDTDGDGAATQEDEFVSVRNITDAPVDISGLQIWTSSVAEAGGSDSPQLNDGLYHTFPPGTVLNPGETLFVVTEITGTPVPWMQEASEGGVESAPGSGASTNFLTDGGFNATAAESLALVDPVSGDYMIVNMAGSAASAIESGTGAFVGFPGTTKLGESNAANSSGVEGFGAGSSYTHNEATGFYNIRPVMIMCFAAGTQIAVPRGSVAVETLAVGDLVETLDNGPQPIRAITRRDLAFEPGTDPRHKPIEFKPGSLGRGRPHNRLVVSPQHCMVVKDDTGSERLVPAKALVNLQGVRVMNGCRAVSYVHLVLDQHEILIADGAFAESMRVGAYAVSASGMKTKRALIEVFPGILEGKAQAPARPLMSVGDYRRAWKHATGQDRAKALQGRRQGNHTAPTRPAPPCVTGTTSRRAPSAIERF